MRLRFAISVIGLSAGCAVNKAPADLNNIQTWFWDNYVVGTDAAMANAVNVLDALSTIHTVTPQNPDWNGALSVRLQPGDLGVVGLRGVNDASAIPGLLSVTELNCTLDQVEALLYRPDQNNVHPNIYTSYDRTFTSSLDAYKARTAETVTWTATFSQIDGEAHYTTTVQSGLRRIPDLGRSVTPFGPILLSRTWMPKPATDASAGTSYPQDYQVEIYYERHPGQVIHNWADWKDITVTLSPGIVVSDTSSVYQSFILANDQTWDQTLARQCPTSGG
jgi:hypothetical protein